jgi:hypothetical protein
MQGLNIQLCCIHLLLCVWYFVLFSNSVCRESVILGSIWGETEKLGEEWERCNFLRPSQLVYTLNVCLSLRKVLQRVEIVWRSLAQKSSACSGLGCTGWSGGAPDKVRATQPYCSVLGILILKFTGWSDMHRPLLQWLLPTFVQHPTASWRHWTVRWRTRQSDATQLRKDANLEIYWLLLWMVWWLTKWSGAPAEREVFQVPFGRGNSSYASWGYKRTPRRPLSVVQGSQV